MHISIKDLIKKSTTILQKKYTDNNHIQSIIWWIIEEITQTSKLLFLTSDKEIPETITEKIILAVTKHIEEDYPLQYILKTISFCGLTLFVEPPILIPRPETEEWVTNLINQCASLKNEPLSILDLCTGSGCIALALAKALPKSNVIGIDVEPRAITLAKKNAQFNNVLNIEFIESNLFENIFKKQFDIILSNPPYISESDFLKLDPTVSKWEDKKALTADENGLSIIKNIIEYGHLYLKKESLIQLYTIPRIIIEIGYDQGEYLKIFSKQNNYDKISIINDFNGINRLLTLETKR